MKTCLLLALQSSPFILLPIYKPLPLARSAVTQGESLFQIDVTSLVLQRPAQAENKKERRERKSEEAKVVNAMASAE